MIPLSLEGRAFGALSLSFKRPRDFDPQERSFLARRRPAGRVRARAHPPLRAAADRRRAALLPRRGERAARRARSIPMRALRGSPISPSAGSPTGAASTCVDEERRPAQRRDRPRRPRADRGRQRAARALPIDPDAARGAASVIRSGRSELYREIPDELLAESAQDDEHLQRIRELGLVSAMIVPLAARGRAFGAADPVSAESGRHYDEPDLELAEDLARRAALAIDNSILFQREHEAAVTLQRALLPQALPEIPGLEFAFRYEPAAPGLEVGGDWYEVVDRDDGTVALTIADVAGRGIGAASIMGRLRPTLRALATAAGPPEEAIARLDALMQEFDEPGDDDRLPPPLRPAHRRRRVRSRRPSAGPAAAARRTGRASSTAAARRRSASSTEIEYRTPLGRRSRRGSLLLLYTDGLIERRGRRPARRARAPARGVLACSGRRRRLPRPDRRASTAPTRSPTTSRCWRSRPVCPATHSIRGAGSDRRRGLGSPR